MMKKRALLIGNEKYQYLNSVSAAPKDTSALKYRLDQLNFSTKEISNATKNVIIHEVTDFIATSPCDAISIVYFSGHGFQHQGLNYIAPIDFTTTSGKVDENAVSISEIMDIPRRDSILIIIIDACRDNVDPRFVTNFCDAKVAQDVFLAYASQFGEQAQYQAGGLSHFTKYLCNNILSSNKSVDEIFNDVRRDMIKYNCPHISNTNSCLTKRVCLNNVTITDDIDKKIYDFIEYHADSFERKHGSFVGEFEVFVEASQFFGVSLLDTYYKYSKVQKAKYPKIANNLSEEADKLITFFRILDFSKLFTMDEWHTWYYKNRKINMGEIPPLTSDMDKPVPENGKEIFVAIEAVLKDETIFLKTNLPDNFHLQVHLGSENFWVGGIVSQGKLNISLEQFPKIDFESLKICSPIVNIMKEIDISIVGKRGGNLCGDFVKFHPIHGNMIECIVQVEKEL